MTDLKKGKGKTKFMEARQYMSEAAEGSQISSELLEIVGGENGTGKFGIWKCRTGRRCEEL